MDKWTETTQARTRATARKHGEEWTSSDLELVTAFAAEAANAEIAEALGRTLFAIAAVKASVKAGRKVGGGGHVAASDQPYRGWLEGMGD